MPRRLILGISGAGTLILAVWRFQAGLNEAPPVFDPPVRHLEAAPLCPWREPEIDRQRFFPNSTRFIQETRILSAHRVELKEHLGRMPEPEENALLTYKIFADQEIAGFVLCRRVKGEHGAIELILALNPRGEVKAISLQRLREPESIARELKNPAWLGLFRGRTHERGWDRDDLSLLPEEARISAATVREGVRCVLILHAAAEGRFN